MQELIEKKSVALEKDYSIKFPQIDSEKKLDQDEEFFVLESDGDEKCIRFHDYHEIYSMPGLYEELFYKKLNCNSPKVICGLLESTIAESGVSLSDLNVLDVGAGNGMVGEELTNIGVDTIHGIDIISEAAEATERDRPGVYENYYVANLTKLSSNIKTNLEQEHLNCLITVAALGFGDIPPLAFTTAYNFITTNGWLAFNIKENFLANDDVTGFAGLIKKMQANKMFEIKSMERYCHRFSMDGRPLYYYAIIAKKAADITDAFLREFLSEDC